MYIQFEQAQFAAKLLVQGSSVHTAARITGLTRNTIHKLLGYLGRGCKSFLRRRIQNVTVTHLELDEVWTFVQKKQHRVTAEDPALVGDAYCYVAIDRATRLVVAWHLGKRDVTSTNTFVSRIRDATSSSPFQISTDGWQAYPAAIEIGLHDRASHGRIVKVTGPGRVESCYGSPDLTQTETTYVERFNGSLREWCRRFTRSSYGFSKKWDNLDHALALHIAHYNFCHQLEALRVTPAMEAGIVDDIWSIEELVEQVV